MDLVQSLPALPPSLQSFATLLSHVPLQANGGGMDTAAIEAAEALVSLAALGSADESTPLAKASRGDQPSQAHDSQHVPQHNTGRKRGNDDAPLEGPVSKRTRAGGAAPPGSVFSPTSSVDSQNKKSASSQNTHSAAAPAAAPSADPAEHELSSRAVVAPRDSMSATQQRSADLSGAGPAAEFVGASAAGTLTNVSLSSLRNMILAGIAEASARSAPPADAGRAADGSWEPRPSAPADATTSLQRQVLEALRRVAPGVADGLPRQLDAPQRGAQEDKPPAQDAPAGSALQLLNDLTREIANNAHRVRAAAELSAAAPTHDGGHAPHSGLLEEASKHAGGGSLAARYSQAMASGKQLDVGGGSLSHALSGDRSALSSYTQYALPNAPQSPSPPLASQTSADRSFASTYSQVMASRNQSLIHSMLPTLAKASSADQLGRSLVENYKQLLDSHQGHYEPSGLRSACSDQSALTAVASRLSGHPLSSFLKPGADAGAPPPPSTASLGLQKLEQAAAQQLAEGRPLSAMDQEALRLLRAHTLAEDARRRTGLDGRRSPHPAPAAEQERPSLTSAAAGQRTLSAADLLRVTKSLDLSPHVLSSLLLQRNHALEQSALNAHADRPLYHSAAGRAYFVKLAYTMAAVADWVNKTTAWTDSLKLGGQHRHRKAICRMASMIMRRRPPSELRLAMVGQPAPSQQAPAQFADATRHEAPARRAEMSSAVMMLAELVELQQMAAKGAWRQGVDADGGSGKSRGGPGLDLPVTSLKPASSYMNVDRF